MDADAVEHGEVQVGQRSGFCIPDMPGTFNAPRRASCYHDRQINMVVNVGIAHPTSI